MRNAPAMLSSVADSGFPARRNATSQKSQTLSKVNALGTIQKTIAGTLWVRATTAPTKFIM
jgi:hypothetical protein